jgi:hypothetical protein
LPISGIDSNTKQQTFITINIANNRLNMTKDVFLDLPDNKRYNELCFFGFVILIGNALVDIFPLSIDVDDDKSGVLESVFVL